MNQKKLILTIIGIIVVCFIVAGAAYSFQSPAESEQVNITIDNNTNNTTTNVSEDTNVKSNENQGNGQQSVQSGKNVKSSSDSNDQVSGDSQEDQKVASNDEFNKRSLLLSINILPSSLVSSMSFP
ncbi:MAG: hypothetical protein HUK28_03105 [Methanobrevibacter sp.]|nr:hypothetical protein [Methanobrevibacter sp.]